MGGAPGRPTSLPPQPESFCLELAGGGGTAAGSSSKSLDSGSRETPTTWSKRTGVARGCVTSLMKFDDVGQGCDDRS
jgi:hypothetical protein